MRVIHVITRLVVGGAQENTIASVLGLRRRAGMEVELISGPTSGPEGSLEPQLRERGIFTLAPNLVRPVHPLKDWLALRELEEIFRSKKPDIVHTHSGKAGVVGRLAAARAGVPIIVHTIHGPSFGRFQGALANWVFTGAERKAAKVTSHFVSVSEAMTQQYLMAGIGRPEQFTKIFSGFELEPFLSAKNDPALRARWGIREDDIVFGKIARLFKLKGHEDLFSIAAELVRRNSRIKFLLVGDGIWSERFHRQVREMKLEEHFVFTGLVPPAEMAGLIGVMDVVVHLSRREGLPRALPQSMAAGKPVVAYDCDGAREVCFDEKTGYLIRPGDLENLKTRLALLAGNAELRRNLGDQGRELVRGEFSVDLMVQRLHNLYGELAKNRSPGRL